MNNTKIRYKINQKTQFCIHFQRT